MIVTPSPLHDAAPGDRAFQYVVPVVVLGLGLVVGAYSSLVMWRGYEPGHHIVSVWYLTWQFLCALWVRHDAVQKRASPSLNFGFALYLYLPVLALFYLWGTRRGKGLLIYAGFGSLLFVPHGMVEVMYLVAG